MQFKTPENSNDEVNENSIFQNDSNESLNAQQQAFYAPVFAVNERDTSQLDNYVEKDCIIHNSSEEIHGIEGLKKFIDVLLTAFPDLHITIHKDTELAQGEMIAHHVTLKGTNNGSFKGLKPTNKIIEWNVGRTAKIKNGKIKELWLDSDRLSMLMQVGAIQGFDV